MPDFMYEYEIQPKDLLSIDKWPKGYIGVATPQEREMPVVLFDRYLEAEICSEFKLTYIRSHTDIPDCYGFRGGIIITE